MGWFEVRRFPHNYNEEIQQIDEQILKLIRQRREKTDGKRYAPSQDLVRDWSEQLQMDVPQINMYIHSLNYDANVEMPPNEMGEVKGVIPIMKKVEDEQCEYVLTHSMQYENTSHVFVNIHYRGNDKESIQMRARLMLEVIGGEANYSVRPHSWGGGREGESELEFYVSPALPEDISRVQFSLIPHAYREGPFDRQIKEIVLDKQVDFE